MKIPKQLQLNKLDFLKLGKPDTDWAKRPIEKEWSSNKNYKFNHPLFQIHIDKGNNYGLLCGRGNLLVIDFDDVIFQNVFSKLLPKTFTVKSAGKGYYHLYFFVDIPFRKFPIRNSKGRTLADLQCLGGQVVGPGCCNKNRKYEIVNQSSIAWITVENLKKVFGNYWQELKPSSVQNLKSRRVRELNVFDVMQYLGATRVSGNNFIDPKFGITKGNKYNFSVTPDGGGWTSHHSGKTGNVFELLKYFYDCDFGQALKIFNEIVKK